MESYAQNLLSIRINQNIVNQFKAPKGYKKWILLAVLTWAALLFIFWITVTFGYTGFLIASVITGIIGYFLVKFLKSENT